MAKKKKSESEWPERNLIKEANDAMTAVEQISPRLLANQAEYNPRFAQVEVDTAETRSKAQQAAVERMGTGIRDSIVAGSPEIEASTAALRRNLGDMGPSAIESRLQADTLADLELGGRLSAEDMRTASQNARAAWSAKGLLKSQPAAIAEVLNRQQFSDQRQNERRAAAAGVDAQVQQRKAGDRAFALNATNTTLAAFDPYQRMFGAGGSQVSGQVSGPASFQPWLSAAGEVGQGNLQSALVQKQQQFEANQLATQLAAEKENAKMNAGHAASISSKNNSSATTGALIGAGAMILAALI